MEHWGKWEAGKNIPLRWCTPPPLDRYSTEVVPPPPPPVDKYSTEVVPPPPPPPMWKNVPLLEYAPPSG